MDGALAALAGADLSIDSSMAASSSPAPSSPSWSSGTAQEAPREAAAATAGVPLARRRFAGFGPVPLSPARSALSRASTFKFIGHNGSDTTADC